MVSNGTIILYVIGVSFMKKKGFNWIYVALAVVLLTVCASVFLITRAASLQTEEINIYFVDAETMRLTPVKTTIPHADTERTARYVLDALIEGHDDNPKILRLVPRDESCMTVKVKDKIAYVDLKSSILKTHPDGRDFEILTVYSIVNSLTNVDGIVNVRFTVDGERKKNFMGYVDMRETFIPDYCV